MALRVLFFPGCLPSWSSGQVSEMTFLVTILKIPSISGVVAFAMAITAFSTFELGIEGILMN